MGTNSGLLLTVMAAIALLAGIGLIIGRSLNKKSEASFRELLGGLDLAYASFYRIPYAYGKYRGLSISFKYGRIMKHDLAPLLPGTSTLAVFCRVKVPGTENRKLHLAVFPGDRGREVRSALGWINPEPGVYLHASKDQSEEDARAVFIHLSRGTIEKMKRIAARTSSCAISADWETVMIGRKNSLILAGGDEGTLSQLDFQISIPASLTRSEITSLLDEMAETAGAISNDFCR